ncbi:LolA-like putative outer membrane lipoprotein chaperone [Hoylesella shahii]|jgi:hypothetical protein|uniref:Outer membrane lipoprotein-sorting protein n=1 Tax=Hoylesella shahii DSM 15611 = JCM 12083 TaxID=1122991 RepID=A0A318HPP9_9BACT|nr:LolA-like putative outer membrane lipoprotein chaperone [Hoylesella shahii]PXX18276.1 outer membrane lipoprotein-sorting protein [Hoylesella shahii DSM 15611 = JCM 12083]
MLKKVLLLMCLSIFAFSASKAQTDKEARQVLDKTAAIVGNKGGAQASFKLSNGKLGAINGTISIKGNKFYARTAKATVWFNGKTQWSYMPSTNEVNVSTPNEIQQAAMNPYTFINMYKSGYKLSMNKVGSDYQVHLEAEKGNKGIPEIYVLVDASYKPKQVKMKRGGEWTTITISNFQHKKLSDNLFSFNSKDFPTAEVIDLR